MNDIINSPPVALADYWKEQVEAWKRSGGSQMKFCQAHDLPYHRFVYWRGKFEGITTRRHPKPDSGGFATVDCRPDVDASLTLLLPNGLVLRGICADNVPVVCQLLEQL
jgi:hypothetical protein